jgi:hypothetical protein
LRENYILEKRIGLMELMVNLYRYFGLGVLAFFTSILTANASDFQITRINSNIIKFEGSIDRESREALIKSFDDRVTTLRITSPGGNLDDGVIIGKYINDRKITVEVEDTCASSCANYIFLGAVKKRLLPGAILGFHGDLLNKMSPEKMTALRRLGEPTEDASQKTIDLDEMLERNQRLELTFRDKVGVRQDFFVYANERVMERWEKLGGKRKELEGEVLVTVNDEVKKFAINELQTALRLAEEFEKKGLAFKLDMKVTTGGNLSNIIYFPSRVTLERFGIGGIISYPYPATKVELEKMTLQKKYPGTIVVCDF